MTVHARGSTAWKSPSNIAIIKYWGKHGDQLPDNPSVSITLSVAHTVTRVTLDPERTNRFPEFRFHGKEAPAFAARVRAYLDTVAPDLTDAGVMIESENSFPHSSGIASSASAMSALALCVADLQSQTDSHGAEFFSQVSRMARLGSGSACRSVYGPVSIWGRTDTVRGSSDDFAIPLSSVHPLFVTMQDSILIIDDAIKSVSSSAGHGLMTGHPFREGRMAQVQAHLEQLLPAIEQGNLEVFGRIAEAEALTLHALMMTSSPSFLLMKPKTLEVLSRVRSFRERTGLPVYFTLDAGPNVHLLYPSDVRDGIRDWIASELSAFCMDGRVIHDQAGSGPERMRN